MKRWRWLARLPVWLYRARLGWLLGHRFLLLTHRGRRSGLARETVLEIVHHDRTADTYVVASGWGERADWLRNIERDPHVTLTIGTRRAVAMATRAGLAEATAILMAYARRHPLAFRVVGRFIAKRRVRAAAADCRLLARLVPLVALRVRATPGAGERETVSRGARSSRRRPRRWCCVPGCDEILGSPLT